MWCVCVASPAKQAAGAHLAPAACADEQLTSQISAAITLIMAAASWTLAGRP